VTYRQLVDGHRTGFEPVLLAAAVPAKAGDLVLEAGAGAGAGQLFLSPRVPGVRAVGGEFPCQRLCRLRRGTGRCGAPAFRAGI
jgi:tRNA1(Val) A37 N6-methylase TrmN6